MVSVSFRESRPPGNFLPYLWYLFGAVVALAGALLVYRIKGVR